MNDEQRAALVSEIAVILQQVKYVGLGESLEPIANSIIDRLLTDRAATVAEPDAETVERVAKAIQAAHNPVEGPTPEWEDEHNDWKETYRDLARAAIAAMPSGRDADVVTRTFDEDESIARDLFSSGHDMGYEHAASWLDEALNSVHPKASMWNDTDPTGGYAASVRFPKADRDWVTITGTGTTRREAILNAVQKAKESERCH